MATTPKPAAAQRESRPGGRGLALAALGVVFGDIGTSPLYTFKTVLTLTGGQPSTDVILGSLSLVIWTLIVTPAISVLSALEGLDIAVPALRTCVLPAAVVVLLLLFAIQSKGTARIGRAFKGLAWWEEAFYAAMVRNAARVSDILRLPHDGVVEIGRLVAI